VVASKTILRTSKAAFRLGYRSGLEKQVSDQIVQAGIELLYETEKIQYTIPSRQAKYTPDFKLPKPGGFFYVETKGIWTVQDRAKHILIKTQCPDLDIRFVFSNQNARLYKGSPTTYAMYCEKYGLRYASKKVPDDWLEEAKEGSKCELSK
jgi:predicted nuclease of restriction endonuclease-like RecB superfamily